LPGGEVKGSARVHHWTLTQHTDPTAFSTTIKLRFLERRKYAFLMIDGFLFGIGPPIADLRLEALVDLVYSPLQLRDVQLDRDAIGVADTRHTAVPNKSESDTR
jgi:hypothetical protein